MNNKQITKKISYEEAVRRNNLADKGYFDDSTATRTANIEQEVQILDSSVQRAGMPINVSNFFQTNSIGARPDTSTFIVEYDGSERPVEINSDGLKSLADTFLKRTRYIQDNIPNGGILVPIGANPVLKASTSTTWLVKDGPKYQRYLYIDENAYSENPNKTTHIMNPSTGTVICERASSIKGMFRLTGTQFHISEKNIADALDSHKTSIAIAPFMIAAFGNSPFLAGVDTGRCSSRMELLCQTEQLRSGLPKPAENLLEYYEQVLSVESPFISIDNSAIALDEALSAIHTISRIRVTLGENKGIIRNEFRHVDSQSPYKSMQALLLTFGCIEAFRFSGERPPYKYSYIDFQNAVWGLKTQMHWKGKIMTTQELGLYLIERSLKVLIKIGLEELAYKYLAPLKNELYQGTTQSDLFRKSLYSAINKGTSFKQALNNMLSLLNEDALRKV